MARHLNSDSDHSARDRRAAWAEVMEAVWTMFCGDWALSSHFSADARRTVRIACTIGSDRLQILPHARSSLPFSSSKSGQAQARTRDSASTTDQTASFVFLNKENARCTMKFSNR